MSGSPLIALPPDPASPQGSFVAADGWWPGIDCNALRDVMRIGSVVTQDRLIGAVEGALITVTSDLAWWQAQLVAGRAAVPASNIPAVPPAASLAAVTAAQLAANEPYGMHRWQWEPSPSGFMGGHHHRPHLYKPVQANQLAASINGNPRLVTLFTRAVRMAAASELTQTYRDLGATSHQDIRAEKLENTGDDYRRMCAEAVADMLAKPRTTAMLI